MSLQFIGNVMVLLNIRSKMQKRTERGTEIILHIAEDSTEFLEESRISELLVKYNKFMPIPIKFGMRTETLPKPEGCKRRRSGTQPMKLITSSTILIRPGQNSPTDLKDEDYKSFYRELYPMQFEEPLFHIHLNVDYPFNLTGILVFPEDDDGYEYAEG